jgi:hypothetical protein
MVGSFIQELNRTRPDKLSVRRVGFSVMFDMGLGCFRRVVLCVSVVTVS